VRRKRRKENRSGSGACSRPGAHTCPGIGKGEAGEAPSEPRVREVAPEFQKLLADTSAYVDAFDGLATKVVSPETFKLRLQNVRAAFAALDKDPNYIEHLVYEGY
jgi:hypothetical protein